MGIASEAPTFIAIAASHPRRPECSTSAGASTSGVKGSFEHEAPGVSNVSRLGNVIFGWRCSAAI